MKYYSNSPARNEEEGIILILTRRVGEAIIIGDDVNICILGIRGNQARIGIDAPKDIPVHREEIYERIQREKAGQVADADDSFEKDPNQNELE